MAKAPIAARLTPALASHAESVEKVSSRGRPLAKPSGRIISTRRLAYIASERRHSVAPFAAGFKLMLLPEFLGSGAACASRRTQPPPSHRVGLATCTAV